MQGFFIMLITVIDSKRLPNLRKHSTAALTYFFLISIIGLVMRLAVITPIPINYRYFLHAHSHTALLGWIYLGMTTLIYRVFLMNSKKPKLYKRLFFFTNLTMAGMLIAFPIQGYGLYSISFSTLYLFASYVFTRYAVKYAPDDIKHRFSWKLARMALFYLVLSSLGTWGVGPIMATKNESTFWFNDSLYFFLHFLYSGFFFLTLIAVVFYFLENKKVKFEAELTDKFYVYVNLGIFLSYFLSVLWDKPPLVFYLIGGIGGALHFYGYLLLYKILKPHFGVFKKHLSKLSYSLLVMAVILLMFRVIMQLASGIPYFAELAFQIHEFILGYLHMVFLGIVVPVLWVFMHHYKLISLPKKAVWIFLIALATTELLIFYWGIARWLNFPVWPYYYHVLAFFSILFPVSIGWIWMKNVTEVLKK